MSELDLILSVDTMVVHLAGALGHEPWVMLHADCDWRWPGPGAASIWYPRARLFHQRAAGEWEAVIEEVRAALAIEIRRTGDAVRAP
jgi:ADP-heptose:LPS heptosyltransferase